LLLLVLVLVLLLLLLLLLLSEGLQSLLFLQSPADIHKLYRVAVLLCHGCGPRPELCPGPLELVVAMAQGLAIPAWGARP
jgi:hypothetical protein